VLESGIERELCVKDWLLFRSSNASAFGDELVLGRSMVDFRQLLLVWSETVCDRGRTHRKEITSDDPKVGKELAGLGIGQN
jgi:hypothetical protein